MRLLSSCTSDIAKRPTTVLRCGNSTKIPAAVAKAETYSPGRNAKRHEVTKPALSRPARTPLARQGEPGERRGSADYRGRCRWSSALRCQRSRAAKHQRGLGIQKKLFRLSQSDPDNTRSLPTLALPLGRCTVQNGILYVCERRSSDENASRRLRPTSGIFLEAGNLFR